MLIYITFIPTHHLTKQPTTGWLVQPQFPHSQQTRIQKEVVPQIQTNT